MLELLVVQATARPTALLEMLLRSVANSRLTTEQENLRILWHAGEPLAAGIDFYREAFDLTDDVLGGRIHVQHSMQTNATLITSAWCELFRRETSGSVCRSTGRRRSTTRTERPAPQGDRSLASCEASTSSVGTVLG